MFIFVDICSYLLIFVRICWLAPHEAHDNNCISVRIPLCTILYHIDIHWVWFMFDWFLFFALLGWQIWAAMWCFSHSFHIVRIQQEGNGPMCSYVLIFVHTCCLDICSYLLIFVYICWSVSIFVDIYSHLFIYVYIYWYFVIFVDGCSHVLSFVDICLYLLIFIHIVEICLYLFIVVDNCLYLAIFISAFLYVCSQLLLFVHICSYLLIFVRICWLAPL